MSSQKKKWPRVQSLNEAELKLQIWETHATDTLALNHIQVNVHISNVFSQNQDYFCLNHQVNTGIQM